MPSGRPGIIIAEDSLTREDFGNPARPDVSWVTLFSADRTATEGMIAGVMSLESDGPGLMPHRHVQAEIYYVIGGSGLVTIEGVEAPVAAGMAVFIPGDSEHAVRPTGDTALRIFYVFPTDRFSDVVYRFPPYGGDGS